MIPYLDPRYIKAQSDYAKGVAEALQRRDTKISEAQAEYDETIRKADKDFSEIIESLVEEERNRTSC